MDEQTAQPEQQQATEAPQVDNAAIMSRLDELASSIPSLRESASPQYGGGISEALNQQQPEQGFEEPTEDYQGYDDPYQSDPYGQPQADPQQAQQQAMAQLQSYIAEQVQSGVQSQVQPWIHQQEVQRLEKQYPDLNKPEVVGPLVEEAQRFAQQLGQPSLATSPAMIEKLYLAQQASQRAAQETPAAGDQEVHLEGSGAAQPQAQEEDLVSRVLNAGGADAETRNFWM